MVERLQSQWLLIVRHLDRPSVDLRPAILETTNIVQSGRVVGVHYEYGRDTGRQEYDVLLDGVISGRLVQSIEDKLGSWRIWTLIASRGPLVSLDGREWSDVFVAGSFTWPHEALASVREELERPGARHRPEIDAVYIEVSPRPWTRSKYRARRRCGSTNTGPLQSTGAGGANSTCSANTASSGMRSGARYSRQSMDCSARSGGTGKRRSDGART